MKLFRIKLSMIALREDTTIFNFETVLYNDYNTVVFPLPDF